MADFLAIGDAIAARYASLAGMQGATARPPGNIPATPYAVVWPMRGDDIYESGRVRGAAEYRVAVYFAPRAGTPAIQMADVATWIGTLRTALLGQMQLGLAPVVQKALVTSWSVEVLTYGGAEYVGVTLTIGVWTSDSVTATP